MNNSVLKTGLSGLVLCLALAACGADDPEESVVPELESERAESAPARTARDPRATTPAAANGERDTTQFLPRTTGQLEEEGHGMTIVVDGTSAEAFHQSLEWIAADASREQYQLLEQALQYLRMYSPAARGGNENLYLSLDGLTGEDIVERAHELRQQRTRR